MKIIVPLGLLFFITLTVPSFAQLNNVFYGTGAGGAITTGSENSFFGVNAGRTITTGSNNSFFGYNTGTSSSAGSHNSFFGAYAGSSIATGTNNLFIGSYSGLNFTSGDRNTFIGSNTGFHFAGGNENVFVGQGAGFHSTGGERNSVFGAYAGDSLTGNDNTFIGFRSGFTTTLGFNNVFIGRSSGRYHTTGRNNVFLGSYSGHFTKTGWYNTFVGPSAGYNNTTGSYNVFVGKNAGSGHSTGDHNLVLGGAISAFTRNFQQENNTNNIAVGIDAQMNASTGNTLSVILGYSSTAGADSTLVLGSRNTVSGKYSVAIGHSITVSQPNTMALGGDNSKNRLSVGIGTVSPNQNASLELADTDKGFLINRLSAAQRNLLNWGSSEDGAMLFDTAMSALMIWDGSAWIRASGADTLDLTLDASTHQLQLTYDTSPIDLSPYAQNLSLDLSTHQLSITNSLTRVDLSGYVNTDEQRLSLSNHELRLSGSTNIIDLSPFLDNSDEQVLSLDPATHQLSLTNDPTGVNLSGYINTDSQRLTLTGHVLSISGSTATVDLSTYTTDAQDLTLDHETHRLRLSNDPTEIDISDYVNTDSQELSLNSHELSISGSPDTIDLSGYMDNTDRQEISELSLSQTTLTVSIENGNTLSLDLAPILAPLLASIDSLKNTVRRMHNLDSLPLSINRNARVQEQKSKLFQNHPNPIKDRASIGYFLAPEVKKATLTIVNGLGQLVMERKISNRGKGELAVHQKDFNPGVYYYSLFADDELIGTKKLLVE
ncbi:MAG: hypothetical protein MI784_14260 [Cytophagales bacterium]|nr:hypothetical protein [Cytophagales bacterium]